MPNHAKLINKIGKKSMGHPSNHYLAGEMVFMGQHGTAGKE